jgi:hypothetical protein
LWYGLVIPKIQEKGGALGGLRSVILCLELGFVWLVYYLFGLATAMNLPIWMTALLVVLVDRLVSWISGVAQTRRTGLSK